MNKKGWLKIVWCVFLVFVLAAEAGAQILVTTQLPATGVTQKSQLWNLMLVNTSATAIDVQIELSLFTTASNQPVLLATSRKIALSAGAKVIEWNAVQPVTYNTIGSTAIDPNPNGFLPVGYYKVCYNVMKFIGEHKEPISEECTEIEIAPLSPPQLAIPTDKATLKEVYPQFTWIPPAPLTLFQRLHYELKVVELLPNQSYDQAIQENLPFLLKDNISQTLFTYPVSSKAFERGKEYLWQVTAKDMTSYSVKTDVWHFSINRKTEVKNQTLTYTRLHQAINPSQFISNGILKIAYVNQSKDSASSYRIYKPQESITQTEVKGILPLKPGENFLDIEIGNSRFLREGETYLFELTNSKGEKWIMQFMYYSKKENPQENQ